MPKKISLHHNDQEPMDCMEECESCKENCDSCRLELSFCGPDKPDLVSQLVPKPLVDVPLISSQVEDS